MTKTRLRRGRRGAASHFARGSFRDDAAAAVTVAAVGQEPDERPAAEQRLELLVVKGSAEQHEVGRRLHHLRLLPVFQGALDAA